MKRLLLPVLILFVAVICLGMGELGGEPAGKVPETDVQITAEIVDRAGVETRLTQFSMDAKTYLDAQRGNGQMTIPFQELAAVTFGKANGDQLPVQVTLKSGQVLDLTVRKRAVFYGSTGFGTFVIKARDLARIKFP
jgi:hypothetical protein